MSGVDAQAHIQEPNHRNENPLGAPHIATRSRLLQRLPMSMTMATKPPPPLPLRVHSDTEQGRRHVPQHVEHEISSVHRHAVDHDEEIVLHYIRRGILFYDQMHDQKRTQDCFSDFSCRWPLRAPRHRRHFHCAIGSVHRHPVDSDEGVVTHLIRRAILFYDQMHDHKRTQDCFSDFPCRWPLRAPRRRRRFHCEIGSVH